MVRAQLAIYANQTGSNILVEGNDVLLKPHATMTLALAFHELATNAAKYGALSVATGSVEVKISRAPGVPHPRVIVHWSESGGPPVATPVRRGFGTTIVERSLKEDLDAKVRRTFAAEGVQCILEFSLSHTIGSLGNSETNKPAPA